MFFLIITLIATCVAQDLQWTNLKPMKTPRSDFTAVVVDEYSILTAGGCVSQACPADLPYCLCETVTDVLEIFYPGNNTWATLAPLPRQRFRHGAVIIKSKMYLVGGRNVSDDLITAVDVYDIASNTWSTAPELNWAQATSDYVLVNIGSVLYAIGGYDADYNAVSQTCTTSVLAGNWDCDSIPQLSHGRGDACGAVAGNEILIVGGFDDINFCSALDTLEVYHLTSNNWTVESRLDNPRADSACAVLHGRFHVIGGEVKDKLVDCNKYDIPVSHVEYYILSNNTWIEETPIPDPRFRFAGIAFRDGVMLMGGQGPLNATTGVQPILGTVSLLTDVSPSTDGVSSSASIMALSIAFMTTIMFVL